MRGWRLLFGSLVGVAGIVAACDGSPPDSVTQPTVVAGDDGGAYDASGPTLALDAAAGTLHLVPDNGTLVVTAPNQTQQFQVFAGTSTTPLSAVSVHWSTDVATMGTVQNGLFTATGNLGGITRVTAVYGTQTVSTNFTVKLKTTANAAGIDAATQAKLRAGGTGDAKFKWLYPYDKTVFPRGLVAPTLQFAGTAPTAMRVRVQSMYVDFEGFYAGANSRIDFDAATWTTLTSSAQANDPLTVDVTKASGDAIAGPITESWPIAQGSLRGTVYYNTYNSPQAGGHGAIMRLKPGDTSKVLIGMTSCTVCHSVSADGSTIVATHEDYQTGASFDVSATGATTRHEQPDTTFTFGGLYPDGSLLLSNGVSAGGNKVPGTYGEQISHLYDTKTGAAVAAPGLDGVIQHATTPVFAPDGKKTAFVHYDTDGGHTLATMDFDFATKTFSALKDVAHDAAYVAWPAFTPDSRYVIFHAGSRSDFATWQNAKADLKIAHLASNTVVGLDKLNGFLNGTTYLPYGEAEAHLNYEPTILPVAAGGYYWVVFTSRRHYGNTIVDEGQDAQDRKKLWVAAIDIDSVEHPSTAAADISHPPFYLSGQELGAGNMRGFWTLDACKQQGNDCAGGDECCTGFCRQTSDDAGQHLVCVATPNDCAHEYEKCTQTSDCCDASSGTVCLNGHCARPAR